jgi:hypothetical protein
MADVNARFFLRSGLSTLWSSVNPVLAAGEPGWETDTKKLRIGDGTNGFTSLATFYNTTTHPLLAAYAPSLFVGMDSTAYVGNLNSVTGKKVLPLGVGVSNGWSSAGVGDFVLHLDTDSTNAVQIGFEGDGSNIWRRSKVAGTWGAWDSLVTLSGAQTITGNKTFSGSTSIATLLSSLLSGGYTTASVNDGTPAASSTYSPDPLATTAGNMRHITNNAAFTFAAPTRAGDYTLSVQITNGATAGAVTFTGFSKVYGDALTLTNADRFIVQISKHNGAVVAVVQAVQ